MSADTKQQGGQLMEGLYELRQASTGELNFDHVAQTRGVRVLQQRYGSEVIVSTIHQLVKAAVDVLPGLAKLV